MCPTVSRLVPTVYVTLSVSPIVLPVLYLLAITRLEVGQTKVAEYVSAQQNRQILAWKCDKEGLRTISKYPNEYARVP